MRKLKGDSPTVRLDEHIIEETGTSLNPAILLVKDLEEARVVREVIEQVKQRHGAGSAIKMSASLNDLLPQDVPAHAEQISAMRASLDKLPEDVRADSRVASVTKMLESQPYGPGRCPWRCGAASRRSMARACSCCSCPRCPITTRANSRRGPRRWAR
ncbi:hypothetical protein ACN28S_23435 [Cystobacter fuscus]